MNKYLLIPLVLFLGLVLAIFIVMRRGIDPHEIPSPLINKPAPAFQLPQLHDPAKSVSAADMRGKVFIDGVGHWTPMERAAEVNEALLGFLKTMA